MREKKNRGYRKQINHAPGCQAYCIARAAVTRKAEYTAANTLERSFSRTGRARDNEEKVRTVSVRATWRDACGGFDVRCAAVN